MDLAMQRLFCKEFVIKKKKHHKAFIDTPFSMVSLKLPILLGVMQHTYQLPADSASYLA